MIKAILKKDKLFYLIIFRQFKKNQTLKTKMHQSIAKRKYKIKANSSNNIFKLIEDRSTPYIS